MYCAAVPLASARALLTSRVKWGELTTARTAALEIIISGPLAKASGPTHGSVADVPLPVGVQLRQAFFALVREAAALSPKPVDMSVAVRHEYHSNTPAYT